MSNIVFAVFSGDQTRCRASGLWQWDYGQILRIQGLDLPRAVEIHFSQNGTTVTRIGTTADGVTDVVVPDSMIENTPDVTAYVYLHTGENDGETEYQIIMPVTARPEPEAYDNPEEYDALVQAIELLETDIQTVEGYVATVTAAQTAAEAAQEAAETAQGKAEDAQTASETAQGKAEDAQEAAETAQTAAETAQGKAESAQTAAESASSEAVTAAGIASTKASEATTAAGNASTYATAASGSAGTASTKAGEASASATAAEGSAETASTKAGEAATSATSAAGSASDAASAKTAAQAAQTAAETAQGKAEDAQEAAETAQSAAETAAASVTASAAQIATNTADISGLKSDLNNKNLNAQNANIGQIYYPDFINGRIDSHTDPVTIVSDNTRCITATINNITGFDSVSVTAADGFQFAFQVYTGTSEANFRRDFGWETSRTFQTLLLKNFRIYVRKADNSTITAQEAKSAIAVTLKRHSIPESLETASLMNATRNWEKALYRQGYVAPVTDGFISNASYSSSDIYRCVPGDTIAVSGRSASGIYIFGTIDANGVVVQSLLGTGANNVVSGTFTFGVDDIYFWVQSATNTKQYLSVKYTSQYSNSIENTEKNVNTIITLSNFEDITEIGNINGTTTPPTFGTSTTRVRIMQEYPVHLPVGAKIYLTDYTAARFYVVYKDANGDYGTKGWFESGVYTTTVEGEYWILLTAVPEATITDKRILTNLLCMQYAESAYDLIQNAIIPGQRTDWTIKSVNHRGYGRIAPENTIPAFALSAKLGWKYVETDVRFTSDGVAVLLHDETINRTARNADGTLISNSININNITYSEALTYDFGIWMGEQYAGTKIPTLEDFLIFCKRASVDAYLEIKDETNNRVAEVVSVVRKIGMLRHVTWLAFSYTALQKATAADSKARIGLLTDNVNSSVIQTLDLLKENENEVFASWNSVNITDEGCQLMANAGYDLEVWTPNSIGTIENLNPYISGITSDYVNAGQALHDAVVLGIRHVRW